MMLLQATNLRQLNKTDNCVVSVSPADVHFGRKYGILALRRGESSEDAAN